MRFYFYIIALLTLLAGIPLHASTLPREAEEDNKEYVLDLVTNDYNYVWREIWDGGDNRLRFRLGSNNVRQWYIEEELKLSTHMLKRLRLRFYHSRLLHYTNHQQEFDTMEFEGRIWGSYYVSFFATPTAKKIDNSLGIIFQRRTDVKRYTLFYLEFPRFLNNFTEHHKATSDSLYDIYSRQPVRLGLELREDIGSHIYVRLSGYLSNNFEFSLENAHTGSKIPQGGGKVRAISGWTEFVRDTTKALDDQMALGVEGAYTFTNEYSVPIKSSPPAGYGAAHISAGEDVSRSFLNSPGFSLPYIEFGEDPFTLIQQDTVMSWSETRRFVAPYAWISLSRSLKVRASLRLEKRKIEWTNEASTRCDISNSYLVPAVRLRIGLGARKASVVEGGFIAEYRKRRQQRGIGTGRATTIDSHRYDHRVIISYEYRFRPNSIIKITESIDLDRRDWGQFSVHDHGFFQVMLGF